MVVTADDYFGFLNAESYFSRKLSTILHENTVVILGYSLSDTNLKAILSDYKGFTRNNIIGSNIFLVSRTGVNQSVKDYYLNCYGILVIDKMEVPDFFKKITGELSAAESCKEKSTENIKNVVSNNHRFTKKYLKIERSLYEIVGSIYTAVYSLKNPGVINMFGAIIKTKSELTSESGAWEQYDHLGKWLIYIGSIFEIKSTLIEDVYLEAVKTSLESMSKDKKYGYSWQAYNSWHNQWGSLSPSNRNLIREFIVEKSSKPDALRIVNLG